MAWPINPKSTKWIQEEKWSYESSYIARPINCVLLCIGYVLRQFETKKRNVSKLSINSKKVSSSVTRSVYNKNSKETRAQHPYGCLVQVSLHPTKDVLIKLVSFSLTSYMQICYIVLLVVWYKSQPLGILLPVSWPDLGSTGIECYICPSEHQLQVNVYSLKKLKQQFNWNHTLLNIAICVQNRNRIEYTSVYTPV